MSMMIFGVNRTKGSIFVFTKQWVYLIELKHKAMTTITIDIADNKAQTLSKYAKEIGGKVIVEKKNAKPDEDLEDNDVTHGEYFGENIKRAINILRGR